MASSRQHARRARLPITAPATRQPARHALALAIGCALAGITAGGLLAPEAALAAEAQGSAATRDYAIPAGRLSDALAEFAATAGVQFVFDPQALGGLPSKGLLGRHTPASGFAQLLAGSGYEAVTTGNGRYMLRRVAPAQENAPNANLESSATLAAVTVTAQAARPGDPPAAYAGGQVARGARTGLLGNRDLMDTPFNVTSYTAELIENQQARDMSDVLLNDASVRVTNPVGRGEAMIIRGFYQTAGGGLFNGLPGILNDWQLSVTAVDRVEVFKGPSAMLNHGGSIGGSVNLVPKRAANEPLARLTGTFSDRSQFETHADIGRRFGEGGQFGARVNAVLRRGDAAIDHSTSDLSQLAAGLDWRGERLRIGGDFGYARRDMDGPPYPIGVSADIRVPAAPNPRRAVQQPWEYYHSKHRYGAIRVEYDIADGWTAYAAHGRGTYYADFLQTYGTITNELGDLDQSVQRFTQQYANTSSNIGVNGVFKTGPVSHGISFQMSNLEYGSKRAILFPGQTLHSNLYDLEVASRPDISPQAPALPLYQGSSDRSAALADALGFFDDRLHVIVGLRYFGYRGSYAKSAVTPALGVVYKPSSSVSLYGNYIEALGSGPTAPEGTVNAGEVFPPTHSKQIEAGLKFDLDGLGLTTSVFQIKQPNSLIERASNRFTVNGKQRNRGIELTAFGEVARGVRVLGGVTYLKATLTKTQDGAQDGFRVAGVPELTANLGGELDVSAIPGLTLTGRVIYTGSTHLDTARTQKASAWSRVDLGARYKTMVNGKPLTLRTTVDNIANKAYWTVFPGGGTVYTGAPRRFLLSASVDF